MAAASGSSPAQRNRPGDAGETRGRAPVRGRPAEPPSPRPLPRHSLPRRRIARVPHSQALRDAAMIAMLAMALVGGLLLLMAAVSPTARRELRTLAGADAPVRAEPHRAARATPEWAGAAFLPLPVDEDWIEVDLGEMTLYAYEGGTEVFRAQVHGALPSPALRGRFRVQVKHAEATPGTASCPVAVVRHVQRFYGEHALYGSDRPHLAADCLPGLALAAADAAWLYRWTAPSADGDPISAFALPGEPGTLVLVHD